MVAVLHVREINKKPLKFQGFVFTIFDAGIAYFVSFTFTLPNPDST